jgi:hypothetical protein
MALQPRVVFVSRESFTTTPLIPASQSLRGGRISIRELGVGFSARLGHCGILGILGIEDRCIVSGT